MGLESYFGAKCHPRNACFGVEVEVPESHVVQCRAGELFWKQGFSALSGSEIPWRRARARGLRGPGMGGERPLLNGSAGTPVFRQVKKRKKGISSEPPGKSLDTPPKNIPSP
eukprot:3231665-Amphidinium_carterae.1